MKIAVVGGGTAGWIAAYFICKDQPGKHEITVVESSKIGIIGAGEGSTGTMTELLTGQFFPYSVNVDDFLKEVDGTRKYGIYHKNWTGNNDGYFAPIDTTETWHNFDDIIFKQALAQNGKELMHVGSPLGYEFYQQNWDSPSALHFDGHKVGQWFKSQCQADGVKVIDAVVQDVILNASGEVESVKLDNSDSIKADFFIDCTGFARILMKKLDIDWVSYKEYLPVNTGMPFIKKYDENNQFIPMTTATALNAGWMWNIPLKSRIGCGYVFDSNYISHEEAQAEVEEYLGHEIEPIKFINFESGKSKHFWHKNVLSLGLASAFVEPLEATSIHSTIIQLLIFSKEFLFEKRCDTLGAESLYNEKMHIFYDSILDFVSFHYLGGRKDTEFWSNIKGTPRATQYLEKCGKKIPGFLDIHSIIGGPAAGLWNWIAAGIDVITPEQAYNELVEKGAIQQLPSDEDSKKYITYY